MKLFTLTFSVLMAVFSLNYLKSHNITKADMNQLIQTLESKQLIATCGTGSHGGSNING